MVCVGDDEDIGLFPGLATTRPGRYQRLVLFIKVLSLLCPNLTVAPLLPWLIAQKPAHGGCQINGPKVAKFIDR